MSVELPMPSPLRAYPGRQWAALHTRARHEKKVNAACEALRVPSYLPLRINRTFSGGKLNTFHLPMFPGYVFAAVAAGELSALKRTNSVAQRIDAPDEAALLRDLSNVRMVELAQLELLADTAFLQGQRVLVSQGPLSGMVGSVVRYKNKRRLQIAVAVIQRAILVDVPEQWLVRL